MAGQIINQIVGHRTIGLDILKLQRDCLRLCTTDDDRQSSFPFNLSQDKRVVPNLRMAGRQPNYI